MICLPAQVAVCLTTLLGALVYRVQGNPSSAYGVSHHKTNDGEDFKAVVLATAPTSCSACYTAASFPSPNRAPPYAGCVGSDCLVYSLASQAICRMVVAEGPQFNALWAAGLNTNIDKTLKGGDIVAYQWQTFGGTWGPWYVTGVNDIDIKVNAGCGMRRQWSYFYDHVHSYIICT
ncbi:hypothetical protein BV898_11488 [Hypsibius exemplaris]|uniref:C-type lectin domain-containing protein n=1 Tax=Hypsibius exemplaris TaxID=2072580 RepID=A0A1W0WGD2_HYPEX|nr:hypothetical protein BV898_11488 [Hypsibius exemplaris]